MRVIEGWLEVVKKLQQENADLRKRLQLIDGGDRAAQSAQLHAVLVGAEVVMLEALHRDPHDPNALELRARLAPFGYADDTEMIDGAGS